MLKDHSCGGVGREEIGSRVRLAGWVNTRRDHGGIIFIDLRDREGVVQLVFNPEISSSAYNVALELRNEYVIQAEGRVSARPPGTENPSLPTGEVEVLVDQATILSQARTTPFYINKDVKVDENLRLQYRYLDLRRAHMQANLKLRRDVLHFIRNYMDGLDFWEVETPILSRSTPEGARDYLIPSRVYPGNFYALPQSPQQMKQLLMVSGVEKYYQIARCFRDEDTRADRQPEFTQLDIEMSFAEEDDVMSLTEGLLAKLMQTVSPGIELEYPFRRITYAEAMSRYGSDKPDLRFGMEIADLTDILKETRLKVLADVLAKGGRVKGINVKGGARYSRREVDAIGTRARELGAGGLITIALEDNAAGIEALTPESIHSPVAHLLDMGEIRHIASRLSSAPGDLLLLLADKEVKASQIMGALRRELGLRLGLAKPGSMAFTFIVNFPLFIWDDDTKRWESMHHPFTAPWEEDIPRLATDTASVRGRHYDIVLNGNEIGGGSVRIHSAGLQREVFRILGYSEGRMDELFGHMLTAFEYGAPPHAGIALGIDRLVAILAGEDTIRDVIAFPKNQNAFDVLFHSPAPATDEQLNELHLKICD